MYTPRVYTTYTSLVLSPRVESECTYIRWRVGRLCRAGAVGRGRVRQPRQGPPRLGDGAGGVPERETRRERGRGRARPAVDVRRGGVVVQA